MDTLSMMHVSLVRRFLLSKILSKESAYQWCMTLPLTTIPGKFVTFQVYLINSMSLNHLDATNGMLITQWMFTSYSTNYDIWWMQCRKILLYPNGDGEAKGNCISLFLDVCRSSIPPNTKLLTKYFLCVENQMNGKNSEVEGMSSTQCNTFSMLVLPICVACVFEELLKNLNL